MSKITIFLCAVLFAAATDATFLASRLATHQAKLEEFVATKIEEVDRIYEDAKKRGTELVEKLSTFTDAFSDKLVEDIKKVKDEIKNDIELFGCGTNGVDFAECTKSDEHLERITHTLNSSIAECIAKKRDTGRAYMDNIDLAVANIRANLSAIREESLLCAENVRGLGSTLDAIVCVKGVKLRGVLALSRSIPALTANIGKVIYSLATITPSLAVCTTAREVNALYLEYRSIVTEKRACIRKKIEALKPAA